MAEGFSRRKLLGALGAATLIGTAIVLETPPPGSKKEKQEAPRQPSELFDRSLSGPRYLFEKLTKGEALFVDEYGGFLATFPLKRLEVEHGLAEEALHFVDARIPPPQAEKKDAKKHQKPHKGKNHEVKRVRTLADIAPGKFDADGFLEGGLDPRWLLAARYILSKNAKDAGFDPEKEPAVLTIADTLKRAGENAPGGPREFNTYLDVLKHYGAEVAIPFRSLNVIDLIRTHGMENVALPEPLQGELKRLFPAVPGVESHFDNTLISKDGAVGMHQFLPKMWRSLGHSKKDALWLSIEVHAAGDDMLDTDHEFTEQEHVRAKAAADYFKEQFFDGDQETFDRYFMTPLIINAYNTGGPLMRDVLEWFIKTFPSRKEVDALIGPHPKGYGLDLFMAMSMQVHGEQRPKTDPLHAYGDDAKNYVPRVYALADLIEKQIPERTL